MIQTPPNGERASEALGAENSDLSIPVRPYLIRFVVCYGVGTLLYAAIVSLFPWDGNSGVSIGILIAAAAFVLARFGEDANRRPAGGEVVKLVFGSFLGAWLVSAVLGGVLFLAYQPLLMSAFDGVSQAIAPFPLAGALALGFAIVSLFYLFILWMIYGPLSGLFARPR
ncbi:MAG: ABZJ_00895 family protein [Pseudomonadota bacterium]